MSGATAAAVADAERAIERLNREIRSQVDPEPVARLLLRAEAVASSKIEGLEVSVRRLLKAQLVATLGEDPAPLTATEVLNNVEAMRWAVHSAADVDRLTVDHLLEIHKRLLAGTSLEQHAGKLREQQYWIGGSSYNPCSATYVPPPPDRVRDLLEDLCEFCNREALPSVAQAALAHVQFETIHPFIDGNGRTGRVLIHAILRRRGLAPVVVPPVSLALASWSKDYVNGLIATRYRSDASSQEAVDGLDYWVGLFAAAMTRAVADAETYERRVAEVQATWREALGKVRGNSAVDILVNALPRAPVITVQSAAALIGRSEQAVNEAIPRLVDAGVLTQTTIGRRNRAVEAPNRHQRLHRPRAPARKPRRRHSPLATGAARPAASALTAPQRRSSEVAFRQTDGLPAWPGRRQYAGPGTSPNSAMKGLGATVYVLPRLLIRQFVYTR